jgi:N-acetylglucosaminyldiphosphoundecaprenol N-acetyl-beta-D-mannosaminyltransferase
MQSTAVDPNDKTFAGGTSKAAGAKKAIRRLRVLGAPVDDLPGIDAALAVIDDHISSSETPMYVLAVNPEKVYVLREDAFMARFFESAGLLLADGVGVVMAARALVDRTIGRVTGADLMQALCAHAAERRYRLFLYGATEEVNRLAVEELERRHPGIRIVGRANGYVPAPETENLVARIRASSADILFVALGSPRQEQWIHANLDRLGVKVCQGVGGTFDVIAGKVRRAPALVRSCGAEWLYRLLSQPTRLRRQLRLARFAGEVGIAILHRPRVSAHWKHPNHS